MSEGNRVVARTEDEQVNLRRYRLHKDFVRAGQVENSIGPLSRRLGDHGFAQSGIRNVVSNGSVRIDQQARAHSGGRLQDMNDRGGFA